MTSVRTVSHRPVLAVIRPSGPSMSATHALHFQIPKLPKPTPPSLLKRPSSTSSIASATSVSSHDDQTTTFSRSAALPRSPTPIPHAPAPVYTKSFKRRSLDASAVSAPVSPSRIQRALSPLARKDTPRPASPEALAGSGLIDAAPQLVAQQC